MPELNWDGKSAALDAAKKIPVRLLEFDASLSCGDGSENLIVQGDNLEALKALLPFYRGRVRCAYIDPPYNTGAAFEHYNDNFPHADWLSMMFPRLELLKEFLSDDGSVWISIDDDEAHYLKVICDEIFDRKNFVASVIWQKRTSPDMRLSFSTAHDYILVYAKNVERLTLNKLKLSDGQAKNYKNPDNDPRGLWTSTDCTAQAGHGTKDQFYDLTTPAGRVIRLPSDRCWRYTQKRMAEQIADNRIWFGKDGKGVPRKKTFLSESVGQTSWSWWSNSEVGHNQEAKREVKNFNDENVFDTPKPERLIQRILTLATNAGDLVMDCFLGSGTTAAVAHKMNRHYIGIELGEHATTHVVPRLRQVIGGERGGISENVGWTGGGGFNFCRLGEKILDADGTFNSAVTFEQLAAFVWFDATKTPLVEKISSPLIGVHDGAAIYLLLGTENILTQETFPTLPAQVGKKIIYATACRLDEKFLREHEITFRHIPVDLKLGGSTDAVKKLSTTNA